MKYLLLFLLLPTYLFSQTSTDSLKNILLKLPDDTSKVNKLLGLANKIQHTDPDRSLSILNTVITLCEKLHYNFGLSTAYGSKGVIYLNKQKFDSCKLLTDKSYHLVKDKTDTDSRNQLGAALMSYGTIYQYNQYFDSAISKYIEASNIFRKTGNFKRLFNSYHNMSSIYALLDDTVKLMKYSREAYIASTKTTDTLVVMRGLISMANAFHQVNNFDSLEVYSKRGVQISLRQNESFSTGKFYMFIGTSFFERSQQYDSAIYYFNKAYESTKLLGSPYDISIIMHQLGLVYKAKKDYPTAIGFLKKADQLQKNPGSEQLRLYTLKELSDAEEKAGLIPDALMHLKEYVVINDSTNVKNNRTITNELETKYQTQLKDEKLLLQKVKLEKEVILKYIFAASAITLLLISLLAYRTYYQKRKLQDKRIAILEKEKQLSATQSLLKGQEDERNRLAQDLHDGLGGLLSGVKLQLGAMKGNLILSEEMGKTFNNALGKLDESISEMRRVAHNMMPEALMKLGLHQALQDYCDGFSESQSFKINGEFYGLEKRMDSSVEIVVYRIVQELLNNAVKHSGASIILVQVMKHDNNLSITVEDNGKGFDKEQASLEKNSGLKNIQSRVDYLNGLLDIQSAKGKGTSIHIDCTIDSNG